MKSRLIVGLLLALVLVLPTHAADQQFVYKNATLGTGSTLVSFGFSAQSVLVRNKNTAGGALIYVDWTGQTANSSDDEVEPQAAISISGTVNTNGGVLGFPSIAVACATGTCNIIVTALR